MVKLNYRGISLAILTAFFGLTANAQQGTITWKLNDLTKVGGYVPLLSGKPLLTTNDRFTGFSFNGRNDGASIAKNPVEGLARFTIEVLFKPDGDGTVDPRFIHFEDQEGNRGTFEIRLTPEKRWYLDAFLKNGKTNKGLALIDSAKQHPADQWYWAAMVYDGKTISSYVNGVKELEGPLDFPASTTGNMSFGVRLNKVNWFKGTISEIRIHPAVLTAAMLQKIKD